MDIIQIRIAPEQRDKLTERAKLYNRTLEEYIELLVEVDVEEIDPQESLLQGKVVPLTEGDDAP
ncbi:MAG: hypothetical protein IAE80_22700 [Anaerolinea sp.]|nr:hypothetical protein [Anaerolinea sp.]